MIRGPRKLRAGALVGAAVLMLAGGVAVAEEPVTGDGRKADVRASASIPSVYVPVTPCRVVDTRSGGGGIFRPGEEDAFQVSGTGAAFALQGGKAGGCGVDPMTAVAVEVSITAVTPAGSGYLRAWPTDEGMPNATFLNYSNGQSITNTGTVTLSIVYANDLRLRNFGGTTHLVVDVQGYYAAVG